MHLSWIIPCYNEAHRIEKTLREVDAYLGRKNFEYEIIAVNNNSKDDTRAVLQRLTQEISRLRILEAAVPGKGSAVRAGMLEAQGEIRLFSDADNSVAPHYFDLMEPLFDRGCDVVISSRDPKDAKGAGRDVEEPWYREILGNTGNLVIQVFGVWGIWDTQNGFKACTAPAAEKIFSRLTVMGWGFDIEMLALARRYKYQIGIIPVKWKFMTDSKLTLKAYIEVFLDVFLIRWNIIRGIYGK